MAENKKSFIAYSDWNGMFKALPDEVAGKLIKHVFSYVNDEDPETDDYIINALFEQIKATLKRDLDKWDKQREQRSKAGKKSAELRATKSNDRSTKSNERTRKPTVSVSVSDNVNVINNNIDAWIKDISNSPSYLEGIYMKLKLRKGTISSLLKDFKAHLKMYETDSTNVSEFKRHFSNWLNNENAKGRLAQYQKETKGQL